MKPETDPKSLFLEISVLLTGFNQAELHATGMLDTYYDALQANTAQDNFTYFFEEVGTILQEKNIAKLDKAITSYLMQPSAYDGRAASIITMWYTGNWGTEVITGQAYVQGLVWDAAQTHPPGAKQPGFGSWSMPPL
jgi:hypothetical protein